MAGKYFALAFCVGPLYANVIFNTTQTLTDPLFGQVSLTTTVSDSFNGNPTKQSWAYTLTNVNFLDPHPGPGVPFPGTGVGLFLIDIPRNNLLGIGDFSEPARWNVCAVGCAIDSGGIWAIAWNTNPSDVRGLLPGQSATFGFSIDWASPRPPGIGNWPPSIVAGTGGVGLFEESRASLVIRATVPAPGPPVPEPSSALLLIGGVAGLGTLLRRNGRSR